MNPPLSDTEVDHLLNFIGYGNLNADVWFLGMEEGGGGEENVRARLKFQPVEDCMEAHRILGIHKFHTGSRVIQSTWRGMCYIMLRLEGKVADRESIRNYQADWLGRSHGSSLLCELMPIPKPSINHWEYRDLLPQFRSAEDYYRIVKPRRVKFLRDLVQEYHPKVVIGYGQGAAKSYWQAYCELFPDLKFYTKGQFLLSRSSKTTVVLTDHFTSRTMNGKLDEVVSLIRL